MASRSILIPSGLLLGIDWVYAESEAVIYSIPDMTGSQVFNDQLPGTIGVLPVIERGNAAIRNIYADIGCAALYQVAVESGVAEAGFRIVLPGIAAVTVGYPNGGAIRRDQLYFQVGYFRVI